VKKAHRRIANALLGITITIGIAAHVRAAPTLNEAATQSRSEASLQTIGLGRALQARSTAAFSLVGATWDDPRADLTDRVEIRTRSHGSWTAWQPLESDNPDPAPAKGNRGSSDPVWVGPSDGIEARITGRAGLPAGLRLDLIDPGAPQLHLEEKAVTEGIPFRPVPAVATRAYWGASDSLIRNATEYTSDVRTFFVHHTAGTNNYSCSDSPAIIRSIQAYHVKSKHWNDIGYNFLVDKCGTLFEGRRGGIARPVLGAHTMGFNSHSAAVAVIGNYTSTAASSLVKTRIAQIAAYKLGAYSLDPGGRAAMVSGGSDRYAKGTVAILNRISGHRDTGQTECPGDTLYDQLPSIRAIAAAPPLRFALSSVGGATYRNKAWRSTGTIRPAWQTASATMMMNRYDLYVDGTRTASTPAAQRSKSLTLTPGRHQIRITAIALNNKVETVGTTVIVS
jgi:hypothetical protein